MTRRRAALPQREGNGRHNRALDRLVEARSPGEVKRLLDAALSGLRSPEWGSSLGLLLLHGRLTASQYEAGKRFGNLAHQYRAALGAPGFPSGSPGQKASPGHTEGPTEAERHRLVILAHDEAIAVLRASNCKSIVRLCCERDASITTADALRKLKTGLDALTLHWKIPE